MIILLLEMILSFRNVQRSIDAHEDPLLSVSSFSVKLPVQTSSQLPIESLISVRTQIHQELSESIFFPTNREKPSLARTRLAKPTSSSSLIHAYVCSFFLIISFPPDSLSISAKFEHQFR